MSTISRMWLGLAAISAGIIHLALTVSAPLPVAVLLGIFGAGELLWGVVTFVRTRVTAPRFVLFAALAPTIFWAVVVAIATIEDAPAVASYLGFLAMLLATILGLFISAVLAYQFRRGTDFSVPTIDTSAPRYLFGVFVGGVLAALVVTPALAATDAGKYAKPMGGMDMGQTSLSIQPDTPHAHR